MEQHNIDKQIKEKLEGRTIQPSAQAWDRLDAMLAVAEKETARPNYQWLYIAASFIGFFLIGTIFFSQTEELVDVPKNNVVVGNGKVEEVSIEKTKDMVLSSAKSETELVCSGIKKQHRNSQNQKSSKEEKISNTKIAVIQEVVKNANDNVTMAQSTIAPPSNDTEALLAAVANFPKNERATIKVDAKSLLSQVDGELELTFRQKAIKSINKNYQNAKASLVSRNQE